MSADVKSVPPWKLALIEKRRKQEEEDRARRVEQEERMTQMPTWKRDILLKKQQQKNSHIYFGSKNVTQPTDGVEVSPLSNDVDLSVDLSSVNNEITEDSHISSDTHPTAPLSTTDLIDCDSQGNIPKGGTSEEHIIPIQQNPWLRTDIQHRKHSPRGVSSSTSSSHRLSQGSSDNTDFASSPTLNSYSSLPRNHGSSSWRSPETTDVPVNDTTEVDIGGEDEIFNDNQEVAYGRGFVNRLLKKFKHLSTREDKVPAVPSVPKRSHSTENILDESHGSSKNSPRHYSNTSAITPDPMGDGRLTGIYASPAKARSMENLVGSNRHSSASSSNNSYGNLDVKIPNVDTSYQGSLDNSFSSSGGMQSPRGGTDVVNHIDEVEGPYSVEPEASMGMKRYGSSENLIEDELPRANIVSATRSLFENVSGTLQINKTKRKVPSATKTESAVDYSKHTGSSSSLPNGSATREELEMGSGSMGSRIGGESRDGVSERPSGLFNGSSSKSSNDRNANYKSEANDYNHSESRTGLAAVTTKPKIDSHHQGVTMNGVWSAAESTSSSHHSMTQQKNNQNNNRNLSAQLTSPNSSASSSSKSQSEIINPDVDSSSNHTTTKAEHNLANFSKKRHAPLPPSSASTPPGDSSSRPHVSLVQVNHEDEAKSSEASAPKKPNLHLNIGSESKPSEPSEPLSYRDLYFPRNTPSPSSSSKKELLVSSTSVTSSSSESQDFISTDIGGSQRNGVLESSSTTDSTTVSSSAVPPPSAVISPSQPSSIIPTRDSTSSNSTPTPVPPVRAKRTISPSSSSQSSSSSLPSPGTQTAPSATTRKEPVSTSTSNTRSNSVTRPITTSSSKPANGHAASLTLPIPKAGEGPPNNKSVSAKKGKRSSGSSGSGPGSLLIRPASNLVPTSTNKNAQLPNIKKYNDVKSGVFQPPSANPTYLAGLEDEFDIPVTNIDDVMDDVPVTNIDDLGGELSPTTGSPRLEQDADKERKALSSKYDFVGAGVSTAKNLLIKTRVQKLRITFNDSMTSTYEYPSEQSLLEELPPEPGDYDYIHQLHGRQQAQLNPHAHEMDDPEDLNPNAGASLRSTPGMGSGGGLGQYRSRYMGDYQLGVDIYSTSDSSPDKSGSNDNNKQQQEVRNQQEAEDIQVKPADDDDTFSWSNAAVSSDLMF